MTEQYASVTPGRRYIITAMGTFAGFSLVVGMTDKDHTNQITLDTFTANKSLTMIAGTEALFFTFSGGGEPGSIYIDIIPCPLGV